MRKFMTSGILANMQYNLPEDYKDLFLLNCKSQIDSRGTFGETPVKSQLMMASCGPLHGKESAWADFTSVRFESSSIGVDGTRSFLQK